MINLFKQLGGEDLTPVQDINGIYFKRDDLFAPFGLGSVNGGKLRQGAFLLSQAKQQGYKRILTGCSLHSPQAPMVAAVSKHFGMDCLVIYGGTKEETLEEKHMPRLVKHFGANIHIANSGRSNVLYAEAKKIKEEEDFTVEYGMNSKDPQNFAAFYETTANQVQNIPDELDYLIVTCGSGITSAGIIYGIKKFKKNVKHIILIGNAPNREKKVRERLIDLSIQTNTVCWADKFVYVDLFKEIPYEVRLENITWGDITFHPHYEAKAFSWLTSSLINPDNKILFWIVGSEPTLLKD